MKLRKYCWIIQIITTVLLLLLLCFSLNLFSQIPFLHDNEVLEEISAYILSHASLAFGVILLLLILIISTVTVMQKDRNADSEEKLEDLRGELSLLSSTRCEKCRAANEKMNVLEVSMARQNVNISSMMEKSKAQTARQCIALREAYKRNQSIYINSSRKLYKAVLHTAKEIDSSLLELIQKFYLS